MDELHTSFVEIDRILWTVRIDVMYRERTKGNLDLYQKTLED